MKNRDVETRYFTVTEACSELHVSRNTLHRLALDANAIIRIGSRNVRIDMEKLRNYLELMQTVEK